MSDKFTPEVEAAFESTVAAAHGEEGAGAAEAPTDPSQAQQPPTYEELQAQVKGMNERLGERDREIGELRKKVPEEERAPSFEEQQKAAEARFQQRMAAADPNWQQNSENPDYVAGARIQYNLQEQTLHAVGQVLQEVIGRIDAKEEQAQLAAQGIGPEVEQRMSQDPELGELWRNANAAQKVRLARMAGTVGPGEPGGVPTPQPRQMVMPHIERPVAGAPSPGMTPAQQALDEGAIRSAVHSKNPADLQSIRVLLDTMLDQDNQGNRYYTQNTAARGR